MNPEAPLGIQQTDIPLNGDSENKILLHALDLNGIDYI